MNRESISIQYWMQLHETFTIEKRIPMWFEKGMSIKGIAEVLSQEVVEVADRQIPLVFEEDDVAITLLFHYSRLSNVPNVNLLSHRTYFPIIEVLGTEIVDRLLSLNIVYETPI